MSLSWPTTAAVGQRFGSNPSSIQPNGHTGMDFPIPQGTPLYAADSGNVMYADWATKLSASNPWWIAPAYAGIVVVINHNDGRLTLYAHLSRTDLNPGQFVEKGALIGLSGTTGLSTGPHLHFEVIGWPLQPYNGFYGRLNPVAHVSGYAGPGSVAPQGNVTLKPNQRKVGPDNVSQRAEANTGSRILRTIQANTVETFTGFVRGESVNGNDLWYQDADGFAWSGGFTEQKTDNLTDNTPKVEPLSPTQRRVIPDVVNYRKEPSTKSEIIGTFNKDEVLNFSHWTHGEFVHNTDIWLKGALTGGYIWAGSLAPVTEAGLPEEKKVEPAPRPTGKKVVVPEGLRLRMLPSTTAAVKTVLPGGTEFVPIGYAEGENVFESSIWFVTADGYMHASGVTDASIDGLPKLAVPVIHAPVIVDPIMGAYAFKPDFDFVEYHPAHVSNCQTGNFPANPEKLVIHQFDAKDKKPSLDGVITHFQKERPNPSSAHFAVSGNRIVQTVSLKDRAYHAGAVGNNYIGIEVDPQEDADTVESVKKLIKALNDFYKKTFEYTKHRDVPGNATLCGADIHLEKYAVAEEPTVTEPTPVVVPTPEPVPVPDPEPVPTPTPKPTPVRAEEEVIDDFLKFLKAEYFRTK